jgi:antitoxin HicB
MTKSDSTAKDVAGYLALPYTVVIRPDDDGDFVARIHELPGCLAHGSDPNDALRNLREVQQLWVEECISAGRAVPEPEVEEEMPSGKWLQRVPRSLHRKLGNLARREGVSLNQLVTSMLSEAVAAAPWKDQIKSLALSTVANHVFWDVYSGSLWGPKWSLGPHLKHTKLLERLNATCKLISPPRETPDAYDPKEILGYSRKEAAELVER